MANSNSSSVTVVVIVVMFPSPYGVNSVANQRWHKACKKANIEFPSPYGVNSVANSANLPSSE